MLKYSELKDAFAENDIQVEEYRAESNEELDPPIIVFIANEGEYFRADGVNYLKMLNVTLAVVDSDIQFELQKKIESVFEELNVVFDKNIDFDEEWRFFQITYTFSVLDDESD
jgi:hypothetical protein